MNDPKLKIKRNDQDIANKKRHIVRYKFASKYIKEGDIVLDCACGSG